MTLNPVWQNGVRCIIFVSVLIWTPTVIQSYGSRRPLGTVLTHDVTACTHIPSSTATFQGFVCASKWVCALACNQSLSDNKNALEVLRVELTQDKKTEIFSYLMNTDRNSDKRGLQFFSCLGFFCELLDELTIDSYFDWLATPGNVHHCSRFAPFMENGSHHGLLPSQSVKMAL